MSAYVLNGTGSNLKLAVRFDNLDEENAENRGECIFPREDLKVLKGLILAAGLMGNADDFSPILSDKLEEADIALTVAETLVAAGLDRVEDFPRWLHFVHPLSVSP